MKREEIEKANGIIYLYGDDIFQQENYARQILSAYDIPAAVLFDGKKLDFDLLIDTLLTISLSMESRAAIIENFQGSSVKRDMLSRFSELFSQLDGSNPLIIKETVELKGSKDPVVSGAFAKLVLENGGRLIKCQHLSGAKLLQFIENRVSGGGSTISRPSAEFLAEYIGNDLAQLDSEIEKLCIYSEGGEITPDMIKLVSPQNLEATAFQMVRVFLTGNLQKTLRDLRILYSNREEPVAILAALNMGFCDIYKASLCKKQGVSGQKMDELFGYRSGDFRIKNAIRSASSISYESVCKMILILSNCDMKLKSSSINANDYLELALCEIHEVLTHG